MYIQCFIVGAVVLMLLLLLLPMLLQLHLKETKIKTGWKMMLRDLILISAAASAAAAC